MWVRDQRIAYHDDRMSTERIELLRNVEFEFDGAVPASPEYEMTDAEEALEDQRRGKRNSME